MPIERALGGYMWGARGKVYRGARAREKAARSISGPVDTACLEVWAKDHWEKVS